MTMQEMTKTTIGLLLLLGGLVARPIRARSSSTPAAVLVISLHWLLESIPPFLINVTMLPRYLGWLIMMTAWSLTRMKSQVAKIVNQNGHCPLSLSDRSHFPLTMGSSVIDQKPLVTFLPENQVKSCLQCRKGQCLPKAESGSAESWRLKTITVQTKQR